MDVSKLPPEQFVPGRQKAIDLAGAIEKWPFVISTSILFAAALLSSLIRFAVRIAGRRKLKWDDAFVLLATLALTISFGVLHKYLNVLYLTEAIEKHVANPFREDIPRTLTVLKWTYVFAIMAYTSIYLVKASFLYFFYPLTSSLAKKGMRLYWGAVAIAMFSWACTVVNIVIICPDLSSNSVKCRLNPHQDIRTIVGNIIVVCLDIICDVLIVAIPIIILKGSMMPLSQKVSIAIMLCLSVAMIVCALAQVIGSVTFRRSHPNATAPVWTIYWVEVEACVSLIMTSAVVICGVFRANPTRNEEQKHDNVLQHFNRRVSSLLRLSGSSKKARHSPDQEANYRHYDPNAPGIATQISPQGTLSSLAAFIRGEEEIKSQDETIDSVESAYTILDLEYHDMLRNNL